MLLTLLRRIRLINLSKKTITFLIILHLLVNSAFADQLECQNQIITSLQISNLSNDTKQVALIMLEKEMSRDIIAFFENFESELQKGNTNYMPPKINVKGLSITQNSIINDIISLNAKTIRNSKLNETNTISEKIYKTPEVIIRKYKTNGTIINDIYKSQISKNDPVDKGIFNVTTAVAVGTIVGVAASNALTDSE